MLGARRTDRLDAIAPEIRAAGGTVETRTLDVTDRQSVETFANAALGVCGRVDFPINNAGITSLSPL